MNTVKDLREALAEEVRRLQPPPGLESRVLRQALGSPAARPSSGAASRGANRSWGSHSQTRLTTGVRATGALAAVLLVILIALGIFVGGRVIRDWGNVPARPSTHAVPRTLAGMVSSTAGWLGPGETVQRTTDGGAHWAFADPSSYVASIDASSYFLDATHAWLTTTEGNGQLTLITYRTVNGGKNWDRGTDISVVGGGGLYPRLYFLDVTHGWMLLNIDTIGVPASDTPNPDTTEDALYGTSDGGLHWTQLTANVQSKGTPCGWWRTAFASVSDGWLTLDCQNSSQPVLATHDGGKTWSAVELPLVAAGLTCPCSADPINPITVFDRENAAILVNQDAGPPLLRRLFMTADGGASWSSRTLPGEGQSIIDFVDAKHGWTVAGPNSLLGRDSSGRFPTFPGVTVPLYRTDDGGLTWEPVQNNLPFADENGRLSDLYFVDPQDGFAEGALATGSFLKTEDGGRHWSVVVPTADACPISISTVCHISHR